MPKNLGQPSKLDERTSAPSGAMDKKLGAQSAPATEYPQASFEQQLAAIDAQR